MCDPFRCVLLSSNTKPAIKLLLDREKDPCYDFGQPVFVFLWRPAVPADQRHVDLGAVKLLERGYGVFWCCGRRFEQQVTGCGAIFKSYRRASGITPDGREFDSEFMPTDVFSKFDEEELQALWIYLQSLEPTSSS